MSGREAFEDARRAGITKRLVGRLTLMGLGPGRARDVLHHADRDADHPDELVGGYAAGLAAAIRLFAARDDHASVNAVIAAHDERNPT